MFGKRQIRRWRRTLTLEALEDRLVLSGNVVAVQNPANGLPPRFLVWLT
jgi:hypothetical protein